MSRLASSAENSSFRARARSARLSKWPGKRLLARHAQLVVQVEIQNVARNVCSRGCAARKAIERHVNILLAGARQNATVQLRIRAGLHAFKVSGGEWGSHSQ